MADILHDFPVNARPSEVFAAVTTPTGLNQWWTKRSSGEPRLGESYDLWFAPEYDWRGRVTKCVPDSEFELEITRADDDWTGTVVGFRLEGNGQETMVSFYHTGWPASNPHYRRSSYCWAMYLRVLKRYVEHGETVPYEDRTGV